MSSVLITTSSFGKNNNSPFKLLEKYDINYILNPYKRKLTEEELIDLINEHQPDFIIAGVESIGVSAIDAMKPYVKIISRCGIGMDSVNVDYAVQNGIKVFNTPDAPTVSVAELTLGVMLDLLRKISFSYFSIKNHKFEKPMGNLLSNKTVGLLGCGRVGTYLAKLLKPFNCKIIGYDPYLTNHNEIELKELNEVFSESDILSLHLPITEETKYIVNENTLAKMKSSAYILNFARGGLINENDLIAALKNKKIAGAGLDCFEQEPYRGELVNFENVVLTSHIGSYALEARVEQEIESVMNIVKNI